MIEPPRYRSLGRPSRHVRGKPKTLANGGAMLIRGCDEFINISWNARVDSYY
jgi:hypothetical protein